MTKQDGWLVFANRNGVRVVLTKPIPTRFGQLWVQTEPNGDLFAMNPGWFGMERPAPSAKTYELLATNPVTGGKLSLSRRDKRVVVHFPAEQQLGAVECTLRHAEGYDSCREWFAEPTTAKPHVVAAGICHTGELLVLVRDAHDPLHNCIFVRRGQNWVPLSPPRCDIFTEDVYTVRTDYGPMVIADDNSCTMPGATFVPVDTRLAEVQSVLSLAQVRTPRAFQRSMAGV